MSELAKRVIVAVIAAPAAIALIWIGGRNLSPAVSPGKTVSGAVGGLVVTIVVAWAYVRWILHPYAHLALSPWGIAIFAIVVSVAAQVGDLAESLLKRDMERKDSSTWLRGLGGVLDIIDSPLVAGPVAWLFWSLGFLGP